MNPLLEIRLDSLQDSLDKLALRTDENLRSVLLRLTGDTSTDHESKLTDVAELARAARERCLLFIAREHPKAGDLKFTMATIRVGQDYERIHELATALHKRTNLLRGSPAQNVMQDMTGIMADILDMHELVRQTWRRDRKGPGALTVDPKIGTLAAKIYTNIASIQSKIMEVIAARSDSAEIMVELVLACRHIKRIANTLATIPEELLAFNAPEQKPA